jgi:hypothetical protein
MLPMALAPPKGPPGQRQGAKLLKESISLIKRKAAPGRKTSSHWPLSKIMWRTKVNQAHYAGFLGAYDLNEDRGHPVDIVVDIGMTH